MNKNLTKREIANNISSKTGYSIQYSKKLVNDIIDILIHNFKKKKFKIKNLGTFKLIKKKERLGRNPKTKQEFIIKSRNSLSFKASKNINNIINSND